MLLAVAGTGIAAGLGTFSESPAEIAAQRAAERAAAQARARARLMAAEQRAVKGAEQLVAVQLPGRAGAAAPATPASLFARPEPPHLVLGFVPYWQLASLAPADLTDSSELAYYGVTLRANGTLYEQGPGWTDLTGSAFARLVSEAHQAGDRVLLTLSDDSLSSIAQLLAHPVASAARLARQVEPLLAADRLDGVDLDVEGRSAAQRGAYVTFVAQLTRRLRAFDPKGQLVLDTYPQSAAGSSDFFDVARLAPLVDELYVMGYDMESTQYASADAPLVSPTLGLSDVQSLLQYERLVPGRKLLLGIPFYGYDFTTLGRSPGAPAATAGPEAVDYSAIVQVGHRAYWDPQSLTPYSVFVRAKQDHQTWFDDPVSVALKTALAERDNLAGVGAWSLGAEGGATAMVQALDGGRAPKRLPLAPAP